jgi:hypothetical protein
MDDEVPALFARPVRCESPPAVSALAYLDGRFQLNRCCPSEVVDLRAAGPLPDSTFLVDCRRQAVEMFRRSVLFRLGIELGVDW